MEKCSRWSAEETSKLALMRQELAEDLLRVPQYPDVVGDRRLLRFLRGHSLDVKKAVLMFRKFLKFREDFKVNDIRNRIRT